MNKKRKGEEEEYNEGENGEHIRGRTGEKEEEIADKHERKKSKEWVRERRKTYYIEWRGDKKVRDREVVVEGKEKRTKLFRKSRKSEEEEDIADGYE